MKTPDTATYNLYSIAAATSFTDACHAAGLPAEPEGAIVAVKVATRHDRAKADGLASKDGDCVGYAFG